jgi:protein phosphatase
MRVEVRIKSRAGGWAMPNPVQESRTVPGSPPAPAIPASRVRVDIGASSHRGKVRAVNEDGFAVFRIGRFLERVTSNLPAGDLPERTEETGHVMIVADGIGGREAGEVASRTALAATLDQVLRAPRWALKLDDPATREAQLEELRNRAKGYLAGAQKAVRERAAGEPGLHGMGTTFTGAYAVGLDLFVMHVGDSKAYLLHEGALRKITRDHTIAQEIADAGMIAPEEITTHHMRHVLTRAVGVQELEPEADILQPEVAPGDRLLICSDGLTDMASDDEIARVLAANPSSQDASGALVQLALDRGGQDNVTVIVAGFTAL